MIKTKDIHSRIYLQSSTSRHVPVILLLGKSDECFLVLAYNTPAPLSCVVMSVLWFHFISRKVKVPCFVATKYRD